MGGANGQMRGPVLSSGLLVDLAHSAGTAAAAVSALYTGKYVFFTDVRFSSLMK